jgi:hypothetical protein
MLAVRGRHLVLQLALVVPLRSRGGSRFTCYKIALL